MVALFIGGSRVYEDQEVAKNLPHIIVATPGRSLSLIKEGFLRCENLGIVCVDEADQMLSGGYIEQIQEIFSFFNPNIQILVFSATFSNNVYEFMKQVMTDPVKIHVKSEQLTLEGITQFYVNVSEFKHKFPTLLI